MRPHLRRRIAAITIALLAATNFTGCSKPLDPSSSIPAVYQPLILVVAAVGVGILLTSQHHKNERGGGGSAAPMIAVPAFVVALGNQPFDIALDQSTAGAGGVGALGRSGGGGNYGFAEIGSSSGADNGAYALPTAYNPIALAIDGNGDDWFVDVAGLMKKCPAAVAGVTTCTPALSFSDGLASSGLRSLVADPTYVFVAQDNLAGTVSWAAFRLDGTGRINGSYSYSPGLSMYNADAAVATMGTSALYTIFHKDGTSWRVALPTSSKNSYTFNPVPLPSQNMASAGLGNNYGFLGSAAGNYQLGHYVSTGNSAAPPGTLLLPTITIAFNGQTSPSAPFSPPVTSAHTDGIFIYMLDASGNLVLFNVF